ncbi:MAG TPA: hypothetical protein PK466_12760 [Thermotogota bacterium]|mgnify:CR=1 FL=1|nr:hypothetical protein [Thermotogota bacterium]HPJ88725.1 hypothetical protein [Thermotogota bacterium]HPR97193.1 hypothetical protein [Thermotogota bacterium]
MDFKNNWINWVLESGNREILGYTGTQCFLSNEWVKTLPIYEGKNDIDEIVSFMTKGFPDFTYQKTEKGFTICLNNSECICPLVRDGITTNPALCECTRHFDRLMNEKILNRPVGVEIIETILRNQSSCLFEIIPGDSL